LVYCGSSRLGANSGGCNLVSPTHYHADVPLLRAEGRVIERDDMAEHRANGLTSQAGLFGALTSGNEDVLLAVIAAAALPFQAGSQLPAPAAAEVSCVPPCRDGARALPCPSFCLPARPFTLFRLLPLNTTIAVPYRRAFCTLRSLPFRAFAACRVPRCNAMVCCCLLLLPSCPLRHALPSSYAVGGHGCVANQLLLPPYAFYLRMGRSLVAAAG